MQELDTLLQSQWIYQLWGQLAGVHQVQEVAKDLWLNVCWLQTYTLTARDKKIL